MTALIDNKKARFNYDLLESFEAGIELLGFEVKALREKKGRLDGSYVVISKDEAFILNFHISPYQPANTPKGYDPERPRKLLLTRQEIKKLIGNEKQKTLTIVPISIYTKDGKIKLTVALARGKKKYDKRETIKKRDMERDVRRELKER